MGRWRYLNLAILLAVLVFLYVGIFTSRSPLAPKALGTVVHPWQPVGQWEVRAGHAADLPPDRPSRVQVQFCPACYRQIRRAGAAIAGARPDSLDAATVAPVRGAPHRFAARVTVPEDRCADALRLWVGVQAWSGRVHWASWDVDAAARACPSAGSGQTGGEGR